MYLDIYIYIYTVFLFIRNTYSLQKIGTSILWYLLIYILKLYKTVSITFVFLRVDKPHVYYGKSNVYFSLL